MKLRPKLIAIFAGSYTLILVLLLFVSNMFLIQGFLDIETNEIMKQTELCSSSLNYRISELDRVAHRFAESDDTYSFMQDGDLEHIELLFIESTFIENEINAILIFDNAGEMVHGKAFDLVSGEEVTLPLYATEQIYGDELLIGHQEPSNRSLGIIKASEGAILVASRPVYSSGGPIRGTLVCTRELDSYEIQMLRDYTFLSIEILGLDQASQLPDYTHALDRISEDSPIAVNRLDTNLVAGYSMIRDIHGESILALRVDMPRYVYQQCRSTIAYFVGIFFGVGVTIGVLALFVMNRLIFSRLTKLSEDVSTIDPHAFEISSVTIPGDDEISTLSMNIREMFETLREYQLRLKESERMATIGEISAMVGHDLRNPLQVIYSQSALLKKRIEKLQSMEMDKSDLDELMYVDESLTRQTTYMNKIISDLQDYSRNMLLKIDETDLSLLIDDVLSSIDVPYDVKVSTVFGENFPEIQVDRNLMKRLYTNLITNAIQAMTDGGRLTIEGRIEGGRSLVSVKDTGVGISEEDMGRIFRPLFTTKAKGTGLGLSVCQRIVESHEGEIIIESQEGVGSTFTVALPLVLHAPDEAP
ncbi:MAG TPA: ATP-binding protein [Patescibacteria group bacterium]|nr:ATP-binding protein [Patescibacteria group bacterium]